MAYDKDYINKDGSIQLSFWRIGILRMGKPTFCNAMGITLERLHYLELELRNVPLSLFPEEFLKKYHYEGPPEQYINRDLMRDLEWIRQKYRVTTKEQAETFHISRGGMSALATGKRKANKQLRLQIKTYIDSYTRNPTLNRNFNDLI